MKTADAQWRLVSSSNASVASAFTAKSVTGSLAAQSCEGWAAAWTTTLMSEPYSSKMFVIAGVLRISSSRWM